jgi:type VI secretion system protein ImpF
MESEHLTMPSILDRLLDDEPGDSTEPRYSESFSVEKLRQTVGRDLEFLLNTRRTRPDLADKDSEIATSLLTYGLPDFASLSQLDGNPFENARQLVEETIQSFEPRLHEVEVEISPLADRLSRRLHLNISGVLQVDPIAEPVHFSAEVDASIGSCRIE